MPLCGGGMEIDVKNMLRILPFFEVRSIDIRRHLSKRQPACIFFTFRYMSPCGGGMEIEMIYLDNASTTRPTKAVKEAVAEAMELFGNPSSMHSLGIKAESIIKKAKKNAAAVIGVQPENIIFTSGGTESNNSAIIGYCRANKKRGNHIITTAVEHPSVLAAFDVLEEEGFRVTRLGVNGSGVISTDELENALTPDTLLVSVMLVNNEVGAIMPIDRIKPLMKEKSPFAVLHVDAVQGFGRVECKPKAWGIDMLSASGHKIHGIKGCGILYVAPGVNYHPIIVGGGQQRGLRSGTENVPGIAGFSAACEGLKNYNAEKAFKLRELLKNEILKNIDKVKINEAPDEIQSGYVLNVSFLGIKAEILLHSLEMHEVYVSTGSACSTNKPAPSHVLTAMGCTPAEITGAVRFSLSDETTQGDISAAAEAVKKEVAQIRKYVR